MKAHSSKQARAARAANLLGITERSSAVPPPSETEPLNAKHHPKKHAPGSLTEGTSVWYRGERWWVERAPANWEFSASVRITDTKPTGREPSHKRTTFYVHADCVDIAPVKGGQYDKQTTLAQEATKERQKAGIRDVGDEAATMLRDKTLDECYTTTARFLKVPEDELRTKYGHLNNGQQRMCMGNRIRNTLKKGAGK